VALVSMPFASYARPSTRIRPRASVASARGFAVQTFHLFLEFTAQVGDDVYGLLLPNDPRLGAWAPSAVVA
jgi:hypothetical protein